MCQKIFPVNSLKTIIAIIVCFFLNSQTIAASELIESVSIFEDQSSSLDLQAVQQQLFIPIEHEINFGYSTSVLWLRLQILPASDGSVVVLSLTSRMLNKVDLFVPVLETSGIPTDGKENQKYAVYEKSNEEYTNIFEITPPKGGATYFLRLTSNGSISISLSAKPFNQAMQFLILRNAQNLFYLFFMCSLLAWSFLKFLQLRQSVFGFYIPMQTAWIFHNLISFGYLRLLFSNIDQSTLIEIFRYLVFLLSILVDLFHRSVLTFFNPAYNLIRLLDLHIIFSVVIAVFYVFTKSSMALQINAVNIAISPIIFFIIAASARKEGLLGIFSIKIFYATHFILSMLWVLQLFGVESYNQVIIDGPVIYGFFVGVMLFFIQLRHVKGLFLAAEKASRDLEEAKQAEASTRATKETLFKFLNMLSHETKNALSVINMTISTSQISDTHRERIANSSSNLNRVIERCNQALHLEEIGKRINIQICSLKQILERHCNNNAMKDRINLTVPKDLRIRADPVLLDVIFVNLLENALKYSPLGSPVSIKVTTDDHVIVIKFENFEGASGAPDPERVFERHYRHQNVHGQPGSGLGLYIVREMINAHNGRICYHRTEVGIQFRITLPC